MIKVIFSAYFYNLDIIDIQMVKEGIKKTNLIFTFNKKYFAFFNDYCIIIHVIFTIGYYRISQFRSIDACNMLYG